MVDVILLERVEKLGQMGQVVKVKPGFARNYLLPQKKAMRATKENLAYFETQRAQLEANNLHRKSEASEIGTKLEGLTVVLIRQAGESGQLYGSVMARDISDAVTAAGLQWIGSRSCSTGRSRHSACIGSGSCCIPRSASR
jgi:large subunit ribosomal protein L9